MAKQCIVLLLTMHVFSCFYFSHGGGLVAITEFVFHCVNLRGVGDFTMCIFCTRCHDGGGENSVSVVFSSRGGGSDHVYFIT